MFFLNDDLTQREETWYGKFIQHRELAEHNSLWNHFHHSEGKIIIYDPGGDTGIGSSPFPSVSNPRLMLSSPVSMCLKNICTTLKQTHTQGAFCWLCVCACVGTCFSIWLAFVNLAKTTNSNQRMEWKVLISKINALNFWGTRLLGELRACVDLLLS